MHRAVIVPAAVQHGGCGLRLPPNSGSVQTAFSQGLYLVEIIIDFKSINRQLDVIGVGIDPRPPG